jgi:HK97 family phage major capsid protein
MLERAVGTGAFTGLVVPQYVVQMVAPAVAAMRPFADICTKHALPDAGMSLNISRITTATSAALQATENTAVSETGIDDTLLTVNVQTAAGQQTASRQAIERGTLTEEVIVQDLMRRYATVLDSTLLNQASTGLAAASTLQTYTNATVDTTAIPAAWKQLIQAQNTVESNLLAQAPPSHFIMHPRRWNWFTAAVSSTWP